MWAVPAWKVNVKTGVNSIILWEHNVGTIRQAEWQGGHKKESVQINRTWAEGAAIHQASNTGLALACVTHHLPTNLAPILPVHTRGNQGAQKSIHFPAIIFLLLSHLKDSLSSDAQITAVFSEVVSLIPPLFFTPPPQLILTCARVILVKCRLRHCFAQNLPPTQSISHSHCLLFSLCLILHGPSLLLTSFQPPWPLALPPAHQSFCCFWAFLSLLLKKKFFTALH